MLQRLITCTGSEALLLLPPPTLQGLLGVLHGSTLHALRATLAAEDDERAAEPVLAPARRTIPPIRIGGGGIDTAFLVVLLVLSRIVGLVVCNI